MKIRNQNHDEQVREIIEEMKAQGVLDEILPPGQTGIIEIEFSGRKIQYQVTWDCVHEDKIVYERITPRRFK